MHVLIVGAGLGGIMLAALLERAGVPYVVLERCQEVKPLGSAMTITPTIFPVFKQLGIFEEVIHHSLPVFKTTNHTYPTSKPRVDDLTFLKQRYDDYMYIITRPKLYDILLQLIPYGRIHFGRKVSIIQQTSEGVIVRTATGETYFSDVLIGADGAYSVVRQAMHQHLHATGALPKEDDAPPSFKALSLVGVTNALPEDIFDIPEGECRYDTLLCKNLPYITACCSQPDGRIAWFVLQHIGNLQTRDEEHFQNSEWGSGTANVMADAIRQMPSPFGHTMGYLIDNTPQEGMSKVMQEEKFYKTWTCGRIALLGDACHKFFPTAGQSAPNAMLDAVVLANVLHACPSALIEDIENCFAAYVEERFIPAKNAYAWSAKAANLYKRTLMGQLSRFVFAHLPQSNMTAQFDKVYADRPQAAFLPQIAPKGSCLPVPQRSYDRLKRTVSKAFL